MSGQWTSEKLERVKEELLEAEIVSDRIVIGGPSKHGSQKLRGFGPDKTDSVQFRRKKRGNNQAGIPSDSRNTI